MFLSFYLRCFFVALFVCIPAWVSAGFVIYSALPNTFDDRNLEYIELRNTSIDERSLLGYTLQDRSQKTYEIGDISLRPNENIRFIRPDTRLILNNIGEEIRLLNPQWDIVDEVSYTRSVRGEEIVFFEEGISDVVSDEAALKIFFSDEVEVSNSWNVPDLWSEALPRPEIQWRFQQPSDILDRDELSDIYYCDLSKDSCRVNLDFRPTFEGFRMSDYSCETSFWFVSGQENRCNPNTIVFPEGEHQVSIVIIPDDNQEDIISRDFIIRNIPLPTLETTTDLPENQEPQVPGAWTQVIEIRDNSESVSSGVTTPLLEQSSKDMLQVEASPIDIIPRVPEIVVWFQRPSDILSREAPLDLYYCDPGRESCRINFDFRGSFRDGLRESQYICETDFWFISDQENRCNPNTIIFSEWEHTIRVAIALRDNPWFFVERFIRVVYDPDMREESIPTPESDTTVDAIPEITLEDIPEVVIDFQRPSDVELVSGGKYTCDSSRQVCRINFDLRPSFWAWLRESEYICRSDFGFETWQEERCNPNTISVPIWEHRFVFQIFHRDRGDVFQEFEIEVSNPWFINPDNGSSSSRVSTSRSSSSRLETLESIWISTPRIDIQTWLSREGYNLFCDKDVCKINLQYEKKHKDERCVWKFPEGIYRDSTAYRCNPGYVEYGPWRHKVTLSVYQKNKRSNARESSLYFSVWERGVSEISTIDDIVLYDPELVVDDLKIHLQWKIWKNKTLLSDTLICETKTTCSINFDSSMQVSGDTGDLSYYWDFGDGSYSQRSNPLSKKFEPWQYEISLEVRSGEKVMEKQFFLVSVISEKISNREVGSSEILPVFTGSLRISSLLVNPVGTDIREWIEIENTGTTSTDLQSCFLQRGSKKYKFRDIEPLSSWQKYKVFATVSAITLPNRWGKLELVCNKQILDQISWEEIPEGNIFYRDGTQTQSSYQIGGEDFVNREDYRDFVEESFYMTTRVLKKGIKIRIQTLSNTPFELRNSLGYFREWVTDHSGFFEFTIIWGLAAWDHVFTVSFSDTLWQDYRFQSDSVSISKQDLNNFWSSNTRKKTRKVSPKKDTVSKLIFPSNNESSEGDSIQQISLYRVVLYSSLLFISAMILWVLLMYKHLIGSNTLSYHTTIFTTKQRVMLLVS